MTLRRALALLLLAASVRAGNRETAAPVVGPIAPVPVLSTLPAFDVKAVNPGAQIPTVTPAAIPALVPAAVAVAPGQVQAVASPAQAQTIAPEAQVSEGRHKFDGALEPEKSVATPVAAPSPAALVEAYQAGTLDQSGATEAQKQVMARAADRAIREKLKSANFKVFYLYGGFFGTKMYEAPELPGVLLKTYARLPLMGNGRAWKGYQLAKERLGGLFAETTLAEGVEVTINGKKRVIKQALIQEKVRVENVEGYGRRSYDVLVKMLKRGVRDDDSRPRNIEAVDQARNLGETADGRLVHFDADFFAKEKSAEEGPQRVRDPPVLREAIESAQIDALDRLKRGLPPADPELDAAAALLDRSLEGRDAARKQTARILSMGRRAGFDDRQGVKLIVARILEGKGIEYKQDFYVSGQSSSGNGVLDVTIFAVHHDPSKAVGIKGFKTGKAENPDGANRTYLQVLYAVLKGAALKTAADPSIKTIRIKAWRVMNEDLVESYERLGFKREMAGFPKTVPSAYTLEFPVQR